jgi:signal transduction histidine kinase
MLNLVSNALKYGNGQPVEVVLTKDEKNAEIVVKDFGIGIPAEYQNRIFERFERAVSSYQFAGLGVGLYITRQIVLGHNGQIFVTSIPGKGSEFRVKLPINC